jgi:predicted aspartyl protease
LNALIDTGASDVFIDASIAAELNLRERNPRTIKTIRGDAGGSGFAAYLAIPDLDFGENFEGVALRMQGQGRMNYDMVLGRTFLERYRIQYDGPSGTMLFEWDLPNHHGVGGDWDG